MTHLNVLTNKENGELKKSNSLETDNLALDFNYAALDG